MKNPFLIGPPRVVCGRLKLHFIRVSILNVTFFGGDTVPEQNWRSVICKSGALLGTVRVFAEAEVCPTDSLVAAAVYV